MLNDVKWRSQEDKIEFYFQLGDIILHISRLSNVNKSYNSESQWLLLKELIDNGQAFIDNETVSVPNDTIGQLSLSELRTLNLPDYCPYDIFITSGKYTLQDSSLTYRVNFKDYDGNPVFIVKRTGLIIINEYGAYYLLTVQQSALLDAIEEFNDVNEDQKILSNNLLEFAKIKKLSIEVGALLEKYLNDQEIISPQRIGLRLNRISERLEILPDISELTDIENNNFIRSFKGYQGVKDIYTITDMSGKRKRIVFNEAQQESLEPIKKLRQLTRKETSIVVNNPELFFNPDVFDLDLQFSERVRQIGFYKPRIYPFIAPYKSKWLPGFSITDDNDESESKKIIIHSEGELNEIEMLVNEARIEGKRTAKWNEIEFPIEEIEKQIPFFRRQLKRKTKPNKGIKTDDGDPVLIIEEHIDDVAAAECPESKEITHRYEEPPDIKKDNINIYPHQKEGIAWLQSLYIDGHPGCLLADDMGLGKTLQVLSLINWHHHYCKQKSNKNGSYLIVAPVTLLENWENEYKTFFMTDIKMVSLYGGQLGRYKTTTPAPLPNIEGVALAVEARKKRGALDVIKLSRSDMVLTTYETMRDFQIDLGQVYWDIIVLDEAQKIKTPGTLVTNAAKALKGGFKVACTGTPVENSLVDLWCITDFSVPGYLGSAKDFAKKYQKALNSENAEIKQVGEAVRKQIGIYFKRRLKNDILKDLPSKHVHIVEAIMPEEQRQRYDGEINVIKSVNKSTSNEGQILQAIRLLRKISDHPFMERLITINNIDEYINQSAKLKATVQKLQEIKDKNEKVILFSESRETCQMLQRVISLLFEIPVQEIYIVNGEMPATTAGSIRVTMSRQTAINRFEEKQGFNVIIMSPLSAGVGLNITGANHVIHYSRWWNPAKEDQATDRVYRIGQELPVHVYIPLSIHPDYESFDVTLERLLSWKRSIMQDTLFPTEKAEVTPAELFNNITKSSNIKQYTIELPISMSDIEFMDPFDFEALIATLYSKMGMDTLLTPKQGDKGVDVIAINKKGNTKGILIQVKQLRSGRNVGIEAVREVYSAKKYFEEKYLTEFDCCVVTNAGYLHDTMEIGRSNEVQLYNGHWLNDILNKHQIAWHEVTEKSLQRMSCV